MSCSLEIILYRFKHQLDVSLLALCFANPTDGERIFVFSLPMVSLLARPSRFTRELPPFVLQEKLEPSPVASKFNRCRFFLTHHPFSEFMFTHHPLWKFMFTHHPLSKFMFTHHPPSLTHHPSSLPHRPSYLTHHPPYLTHHPSSGSSSHINPFA